MKKFIFTILLSFSGFILNASTPNILFLFADDMTTREFLRDKSERQLQIPNIDKLINSGTTFTNTYLMGSWVNAVCVSSRTCLNTGYSVWKGAKAYKNKGALLTKATERRELLPQLLKAAGYKTYLTGKWHVLADPKLVFDETEVVRTGMPKTNIDHYNRPVENQADSWNPADPNLGGYFEGEKHWSEITADCAINYLGRNKDSNEPFFMYVAFNAPHDPRQAPKEFQELYPVSKIKLPKNFESENKYAEAINVKNVRDETLAPYPRTPFAIRTHLSEYYAITTHLDVQIGRILDALRESGKLENTIIVFAADNGLSVGENGFMGKQNMFDAAMKVPLVISGKGFEKNKKIPAKIYLQDLMPTFLDLAGSKIPEFVEYQSLMPLVKNDKSEIHQEIYIGFMETQKAIIDGDFKLISYPNIDVALLFDLTSDPYEMNDLSKDEKFSETLKKLEAKLENLDKKYKKIAEESF